MKSAHWYFPAWTIDKLKSQTQKENVSPAGEMWQCNILLSLPRNYYSPYTVVILSESIKTDLISEVTRAQVKSIPNLCC